ncbi:MAG: hypothetical protein LDL33_03985 [Desulfomonile sp.]|nr:hypothetical protein [Desulfomonile sp.]
MVRTVIFAGGLMAAVLGLILPPHARAVGYGQASCPQPAISVCQPVVPASPCCVPSPLFPPPPHLVAPVIAAPRPMILLPPMCGPGAPGYVPMTPPGAPTPIPRTADKPKPAGIQPGIVR